MDDARLTRSQVAQRLGISPERVRQLTKAGRLPCEVTPLGRLYREGDVERLSAERARSRATAS